MEGVAKIKLVGVVAVRGFVVVLDCCLWSCVAAVNAFFFEIVSRRRRSFHSW